jgi:hypothetical protein
MDIIGNCMSSRSHPENKNPRRAEPSGEDDQVTIPQRAAALVGGHPMHGATTMPDEPEEREGIEEERTPRPPRRKIDKIVENDERINENVE